MGKASSYQLSYQLRLARRAFLNRFSKVTRYHQLPARTAAEATLQLVTGSWQLLQYGPMMPPMLRSAGFVMAVPLILRAIPIACEMTSMYLSPVPVLKITTS